MRSPRSFRSDPASPRLARLPVGDRTELWTEAVGTPPPVYGERWAHANDRAYRVFEPGRSKLSAAIVRSWDGPVPRPGERWLYLGAATGSTASHVADLVGPEGTVYALERSARSFARLLGLAARWPNLRPILGDARATRDYAALVPPVDGIYLDIAQPDQVDIARANAELYLRGRGAALLVALKTASMGRDRPPEGHLASAEGALAPIVDLVPSVRLDPFHRGHYFVGGRAREALFGAPSPRPVKFTSGPRRAPRPR